LTAPELQELNQTAKSEIGLTFCKKCTTGAILLRADQLEILMRDVPEINKALDALRKD